MKLKIIIALIGASMAFLLKIFGKSKNNKANETSSASQPNIDNSLLNDIKNGVISFESISKLDKPNKPNKKSKVKKVFEKSTQVKEALKESPKEPNEVIKKEAGKVGKIFGKSTSGIFIMETINENIELGEKFSNRDLLNLMNKIYEFNLIFIQEKITLDNISHFNDRLAQKGFLQVFAKTKPKIFIKIKRIDLLKISTKDLTETKTYSKALNGGLVASKMASTLIDLAVKKQEHEITEKSKEIELNKDNTNSYYKDNGSEVNSKTNSEVSINVDTTVEVVSVSEIETIEGFCNFSAKNDFCLNRKTNKMILLKKIIEIQEKKVGTLIFKDPVTRWLCDSCYKDFNKSMFAKSKQSEVKN